MIPALSSIFVQHTTVSGPLVLSFNPPSRPRTKSSDTGDGIVSHVSKRLELRNNGDEYLSENTGLDKYWFSLDLILYILYRNQDAIL